MSVNGLPYSVSWSDFKHVRSRPEGEDEDANIEVRYDYNYQPQRKGNATGVSSSDVNITMLSSDCWVVSSETTSELLEHEQGHYDITSLGAQEFYNALLKLTAKSTHALKTSITLLNQKYQQKINSANKRYDKQTEHSRNKTAQQTWNQKIGAELKKPDGSIDNLPL